MNRFIDWMGGEPPSSWEIFKLKHVLREEAKEIGADVPAGAISFGEVVFKNFDNDETLATYRTVRRGQFLINPLNLNYDLKSLRLGLSEIECRVSPAYIVASHDPQRATSKYLRWALRVFDVQHIKTLGAGVRQTLTFEDIGGCRIALPDLDTQKLIDTYLKSATTRIDNLVAKKTRFIELLREKRQALITHAVTKGLNANVPIKDSGVDWLGKVPAHWDVSAIRRIARLKSGDVISSDAIEDSGSFRVFGGNGVRGFASSFTHDGEFAIIGRQGALCGNVHLAEGKFWASEHAIVATPLIESDVYWLCSVFETMNFNQYATAAAQPGIAVETIARLPMPIPPLNEQRAISRYIKNQTTRIDTLIAKTERSIELLREHRNALITAAVTGKLNLRTAA